MRFIFIYLFIFLSTSAYAEFNITCLSSLLSPKHALVLKMNKSSTVVVWLKRNQVIFETKITSRNANNFNQNKSDSKIALSFKDIVTNDKLNIEITNKEYQKFLTKNKFKIKAYVKDKHDFSIQSSTKLKCYK